MLDTLQGKHVLFLGGSSGIGLAAAKLAKAREATVTLVGRDKARLEGAVKEVSADGAESLDAEDMTALEEFLSRVTPPDHVFVTTGGPFYGPWNTLDLEGARRAFDRRVATMLYVARYAAPRMPAGGSITFMGGTGSRHVAPGLGITGAMNVAADALTRQLAVEVAPVRVNLIAAGFVDTEMSARLLGDALESRREALRDTLPIRRVVQAEDVADFALYLMAQTAATGTTFDLDGGQSLL